MTRRIGWIGWLTVAALACRPPDPSLVWTPLDDVNAGLPGDVEVLEGVDRQFPLRAWVARIPAGSGATIRVHQSDDPVDLRETVESFAADEAACVAVNGGYFAMDRSPSVHGGLLLSGGRLLAPATRRVTRDEVEYPTRRAALGIRVDGTPEVTWASTRHDSVFSWSSPTANRPGTPASDEDSLGGTPWAVVDAVGAGPRLLQNGRIAVADDEEVFFGSSIPNVHPRSAAGVTADGTLLLLVVDGRQPQSRGVDLEDLALILRSLGAVDALNLDGGGSSTMVAAGQVLNRPAGGDELREVMSAIAVYCPPG